MTTLGSNVRDLRGIAPSLYVEVEVDSFDPNVIYRLLYLAYWDKAEKLGFERPPLHEVEDLK